MRPDEYIDNAVTTESCDWDTIEKRLAGNMRLLHAAMGIANEGGEALGVAKKLLFYGKHMNRKELRERFLDECGDVLWYMAIGFDELNATFEEVMRRNAEKLQKRYGGGPFDAKKVGGTDEPQEG